ncbi:MAG: penicillin amidase [Cyclobacteriaceae bacterium]|jgi:penicillin amidase
MKLFRFILFFSISGALLFALSNEIGSTPPIGPLFSPHQGFLQNAEKNPINLAEEISSSLIKSNVKVTFDEILIPHIQSENETDGFFALGYITAYHRLWQMDFYARLVFGRLSEIVGKRALKFDRLNRRIGLPKMTRDFHEKIMIDQELSPVLQAYSNGVNAYIDQLSPADYPIEFKLLNYKPEQWSTLKSCLAYALLSNDLARSESDLESTNARIILGDSLYQILFPEQVGNLSPVIPSTRKWDFDPIKAIRPTIQFPYSTTKTTISKPDPLNGSNNFVVDGTKSQTGYPLFANEPDLRLTAPSIWYASHMKTPSMNVFGVTVPGTPVTLIGFNDSIAWGVTNSPRDQVDWYKIQFKDDQRKEYFYNNQWFKTEQVIEYFDVKNENTFADTIIYTHHGPVVYDRSYQTKDEELNYAMKWVAHGEATTFKAMYELNRGKNFEDYENALKYFSGPPQNVLFASTANDIAIRLPGKFPNKWPDQGKFLMDGSKLSHEYQGYIPDEHQLSQRGSETGFLSSANQHPADPSYPYYVYAHRFEYYRNRRINERLSAIEHPSVSDMKQLQNDNYNYIASEYLPMMLSRLDTSKVVAFQNHLSIIKKWDFFNLPGKMAPTLFELWHDQLLAITWDEFDTLSVAVNKPNTYVTYHLMNASDSLSYWDRLETTKKESSSDLITSSFIDAMDSLENWQTANGEDYSWSKFKNTTVGHLLGIPVFSTPGIKIGGNSSIVNAASGIHGPSWRMVVELDPAGVKGHGVYPGSQTGNPGNPTFGQMIDDWASGTYYPLSLDQLSSDKTIYSLEFKATDK